MESSAPVVFLDGLSATLKEHEDIFSISTGLPSVRDHDHRIPLLLGTALVNVKLYRYPHFQKGEIERLVGEMLMDGIIRPSTSPFS